MMMNEVVETTPPTTSTVAATGEEMADELELITVLGIKAGAGSGEYEVVVSLAAQRVRAIQTVALWG
jgi:hypothetical protein